MRKDLAAFVFAVVALGGLNAEESAKGKAIFNSNCATCHGRDGRGGRGPSLLGWLRNGDVEVVIRNGVPGTAMPSFNFENDQLGALVKHIRSLREARLASIKPEGDVGAGKQLYSSYGCSACHMIGKEGSTFGPNLTRIGSSRSYEYLKASIMNPSADVPEENRAVTIETADGRRYQGLWVNEDSFTVQIRLPNESFASFEKQTLKKEIHEEKSLMPTYHFNSVDLKNLLAYLSSLVGDVNSTSKFRSEGRQH